MSRLRITPLAYDDVYHIVEYLQQRSPEAARHVFDALAKAIRRIARNPGIGHFRDDVDDESLRYLPVFSYLIVYRENVERVEILRVLHGARDIPSILESDS